MSSDSQPTPPASITEDAPAPSQELPRVFEPAKAAEILRDLGLSTMTECALRTRAYRRQVPCHLNGHRIVFTLTDLREIAEGQAFSPQPNQAPVRRKPAESGNRTPIRPGRDEIQAAPQEGLWRARRYNDA